MYEEMDIKAFCRRLRFPDELETSFRSDYDQRVIPATRAALIVGVLLYAAFGVLDFWGIPAEKHLAWFIRYAIVCPAMTIAFLLTFISALRRYLQAVMTVICFLAGFGIVIMIGASSRGEPAYSRYCVGLILVAMFTYTFLRLRLRGALISSLTVLLSYEVMALYWQKILSNWEGTLAYIHSNFFLVGAHIIGITACYSLESFARRDFVQRRIIEAEMASAREVQLSLLPRDFPSIPGFSVAGACRPARQIGGDYFDVLAIEPGRWFLIMADVSGKGAPAALLMANLHALIRTLPLTSLPAKLASAVNSHVYGLTSSCRYVTAIMAILDLKKREITYCNAGHTGGFVVSTDGFKITLETTGLPLGLFSDSQYEEITVPLAKVSTLLLYTDGISERENKFGEAFGEEGLLKAAMLHQCLRASDWLHRTFEAADQFAGNLEPADDATVLIASMSAELHVTEISEINSNRLITRAVTCNAHNFTPSGVPEEYANCDQQLRRT